MAEAKNATDEVAVFGTKEVSLKEFMGTSKKNLVVLEDYDKAKENLLELKAKHEERTSELIAKERLTKKELIELIAIRGELRSPRYLIQNLKKDNASVFATYSKNDKSKWDYLIEINEPLEDTADVKIKAEEAIVQAEKELEAQAEENRINTIKERIDTFESDSYKIIQSTTFDDVELNKSMLDALANTEFDFEEYDILFEQAKGRVQVSWDSKCTDVKQREEQRLENERMKQEIFDVRVNRLKDLGIFIVENENKLSDLDYIFSNNDNSLQKSAEVIYNLTSSDFETLLSTIKQSNERAEQAKRNAEIKKEKDEQFEVRKTRLAEIGFGITQNEHFFFCRDFSSISVSVDSVYNASVTEFEQILSKAKQDVVDAEKKKESDELAEQETKKQAVIAKNKADAENKARVKRLANDKKIYEESLLLNLGRFPIVFESDQEEIKQFSIEASNKVTDLLNELLTQLNDL